MELAKFFMTMSNQVKLYHWQTHSYARHIASDKLFDEIIRLSDQFMEVYQGKHDRRIKARGDKGEVVMTIHELDDASIGVYLKSCVTHLMSISSSRYVDPNDTDLLNIRDELVGACNQAIYLFSFQ